MALNKDVLAALILEKLRDAYPGFPFRDDDTSWVPIADAIVEHVAANTRSLLNVQRFTAGGTYTPTPGTTAVRVTLVGGGGGSGAAITGNDGASAGGSSAEWAVLWITGAPIVGGGVTIGAGGTAGSTFGANGGDGGATSVVINGTTYTAAGGNGSITIASGLTQATETAGPALGQLGSTADDLYRGTEPGHLNMTADGTFASHIAGNGGSTPYGRGGVGSTLNSAGTAGTGFGAGAGGSRRDTSNQAGAIGAPGVVIIEEYGA